MRLSEIQQEKLHCFDNSWRLMMDMFKKLSPEEQDRDFRLVHAYVTNIEGKRFEHAWLEVKDKAIDSARSKDDPLVMDKAKYRDIMNAEDIIEYTPEKAMIKAARSGNYGPWEL